MTGNGGRDVRPRPPRALRPGRLRPVRPGSPIRGASPAVTRGCRSRFDLKQDDQKGNEHDQCEQAYSDIHCVLLSSREGYTGLPELPLVLNQPVVTGGGM